MKSYRIGLVLAAISTLTMVEARAETAAAPSDPLARIAWLIGTWTSESKRPDGSPAVTEVTYRSASQKMAIH
jgi:hypothetical protein